MPPEWKNDDDTKDFGAVLAILGPILLILAGFGLLAFGLLQLFGK